MSVVAPNRNCRQLHREFGNDWVPSQSHFVSRPLDEGLDTFIHTEDEVNLPLSLREGREGLEVIFKVLIGFVHAGHGVTLEEVLSEYCS